MQYEIVGKLRRELQNCNCFLVGKSEIAGKTRQLQLEYCKSEIVGKLLRKLPYYSCLL